MASQATLFAFYKVESNADNEIYLEVVVEALHRALKSAEGASEVLMRLSKKGRIPSLSLHITTAVGFPLSCSGLLTVAENRALLASEEK
jgi:hypothetical protein